MRDTLKISCRQQLFETLVPGIERVILARSCLGSSGVARRSVPELVVLSGVGESWTIPHELFLNLPITPFFYVQRAIPVTFTPSYTLILSTLSFLDSMARISPLASALGLVALGARTALADCVSYGMDFQNGGSYFQNSLSSSNFTFVSEFEGSKASDRAIILHTDQNQDARQTLLTTFS